MNFSFPHAGKPIATGFSPDNCGRLNVARVVQDAVHESEISLVRSAFTHLAIASSARAPSHLVFKVSLSVRSGGVIWRTVGTGSFLELSTTKESRRLHQAIRRTRGRPRVGHAEYERPVRSEHQPRDTLKFAAERGVSHPKVSHQVETNVVTQANRPPVPSRESAPAAPPQTNVGATADDRLKSSRMR